MARVAKKRSPNRTSEERRKGKAKKERKIPQGGEVVSIREGRIGRKGRRNRPRLSWAQRRKELTEMKKRGKEKKQG